MDAGELEQLDRAAERRIAREEFDAAHPEYRVHPLFESILATHAQVPVAISAGLQSERVAS